MKRIISISTVIFMCSAFKLQPGNDEKLVKCAISLLTEEKVISTNNLQDTIFIHCVYMTQSLKKYFLVKNHLSATNKTMPCDDPKVSRNQCLRLYLNKEKNLIDITYTSGGGTTVGRNIQVINNEGKYKMEKSAPFFEYTE